MARMFWCKLWALAASTTKNVLKTWIENVCSNNNNSTFEVQRALVCSLRCLLTDVVVSLLHAHLFVTIRDSFGRRQNVEQNRTKRLIGYQRTCTNTSLPLPTNIHWINTGPAPLFKRSRLISRIRRHRNTFVPLLRGTLTNTAAVWADNTIQPHSYLD